MRYTKFYPIYPKVFYHICISFAFLSIIFMIPGMGLFVLLLPNFGDFSWIFGKIPKIRQKFFADSQEINLKLRLNFRLKRPILI